MNSVSLYRRQKCWKSDASSANYNQRPHKHAIHMTWHDSFFFLKTIPPLFLSYLFPQGCQSMKLPEGLFFFLSFFYHYLFSFKAWSLVCNYIIPHSFSHRQVPRQQVGGGHACSNMLQQGPTLVSHLITPLHPLSHVFKPSPGLQSELWSHKRAEKETNESLNVPLNVPFKSLLPGVCLFVFWLYSEGSDPPLLWCFFGEVMQHRWHKLLQVLFVLSSQHVPMCSSTSCLTVRRHSHHLVPLFRLNKKMFEVKGL